MHGFPLCLYLPLWYFSLLVLAPFSHLLAREFLILILFSKDTSDLFFCAEIEKTFSLLPVPGQYSEICP